MDLYDLIPLYEILCISIILLVPVLPAWCLYRISPKDKILAKGRFAGFQVNATGAIAIFIVLFAAIYANMGEIIKTVHRIEIYNNRIQELTGEVDSLKKLQPWKLQCQIEITDAHHNAVDDRSYNDCLNENLIQTSPTVLYTDYRKRQVSFYIDNDVLQSRISNCNIAFPSGYGTQKLDFSKSRVDNLTKTIYVPVTVSKNSSDPNLSGNPGTASKVYDSSLGRSQLPSSLVKQTNY